METMPHSRELEDKAEIDQAITDILTSTDEAERQELYDFVLTRLHEDAVYIPLTYGNQQGPLYLGTEGGPLRHRPV